MAVLDINQQEPLMESSVGRYIKDNTANLITGKWYKLVKYLPYKGGIFNAE